MTTAVEAGSQGEKKDRIISGFTGIEASWAALASGAGSNCADAHAPSWAKGEAIPSRSSAFRINGTNTFRTVMLQSHQ